jgi:hypothetical protein
MIILHRYVGHNCVVTSKAFLIDDDDIDLTKDYYKAFFYKAQDGDIPIILAMFFHAKNNVNEPDAF